MKPELFEELSWKAVLHEASAEEAAWVRSARVKSEFLAARFDQLQREHDALGTMLNILSLTKSSEEGVKIPEARLDELTRLDGRVADQLPIAASSSPPVVADEPPVLNGGGKSALGKTKGIAGLSWLGGLAAAGVLAFFRVVSHEVGPMVKIVEHAGGSVASHESAQLAHALKREAVESAANSSIAANTTAKISKAVGGASSAAAAGTVAKAADESDEYAPAIGLRFRSMSHGFRVTTIMPNSPAAVGGLRNGDFVTYVDGVPLRYLDRKVMLKLLSVPAGATVELIYLRGEEQLTANFVVTPFPQPPFEPPRPR